MADFRSIDDTQYDAAAAWHALLAGDAREADWLAFTAWLEADPHHRMAFDAVSHASAEIDAQKAALAAALNDTLGMDEARVISLADMRQARQTLAQTPSRRLWMAGIAAIAASALVAVFVQKTNLLTPVPDVRTWTTGVGQHQTVKLEDGSEIQLNTDTVLTVSFTHALRQAHLDKGEAHFDVASDAHRPFTVAAGDRRVDVIGTAFGVARTDGALTVTVARGIVKVGPASNGGDNAGVKLTIGDQYRGREGRPGFEVVKVDPATAMAWRNGRLIFDDAPLSQVISDLNRYFDKKLIISDAATGDLRFSGILKIDDEDTVVKRLEGLLPVTVQSRGNDLVLARKSSD